MLRLFDPEHRAPRRIERTECQYPRCRRPGSHTGDDGRCVCEEHASSTRRRRLSANEHVRARQLRRWTTKSRQATLADVEQALVGTVVLGLHPAIDLSQILIFDVDVHGRDLDEAWVAVKRIVGELARRGCQAVVWRTPGGWHVWAVPAMPMATATIAAAGLAIATTCAGAAHVDVRPCAGAGTGIRIGCVGSRLVDAKTGANLTASFEADVGLVQDLLERARISTFEIDRLAGDDHDARPKPAPARVRRTPTARRPNLSMPAIDRVPAIEPLPVGVHGERWRAHCRRLLAGKIQTGSTGPFHAARQCARYLVVNRGMTQELAVTEMAAWAERCTRGIDCAKTRAGLAALGKYCVAYCYERMTRPRTAVLDDESIGALVVARALLDSSESIVDGIVRDALEDIAGDRARTTLESAMRAILANINERGVYVEGSIPWDGPCRMRHGAERFRVLPRARELLVACGALIQLSGHSQGWRGAIYGLGFTCWHQWRHEHGLTPVHELNLNCIPTPDDLGTDGRIREQFQWASWVGQHRSNVGRGAGASLALTWCDQAKDRGVDFGGGEEPMAGTGLRCLEVERVGSEGARVAEHDRYEENRSASAGPIFDCGPGASVSRRSRERRLMHRQRAGETPRWFQRAVRAVADEVHALVPGMGRGIDELDAILASVKHELQRRFPVGAGVTAHDRAFLEVALRAEPSITEDVRRWGRWQRLALVDRDGTVVWRCLTYREEGCENEECAEMRGLWERGARIASRDDEAWFSARIRDAITLSRLAISHADGSSPGPVVMLPGAVATGKPEHCSMYISPHAACWIYAGTMEDYRVEFGFDPVAGAPLT